MSGAPTCIAYRRLLMIVANCAGQRNWTYPKILFFAIFLNVHGLYAQDKIEREYKIKSSEVPAPALDFVKRSFKDGKVRWYMEQSADGKSIEAKVRRNRKCYSAEFDTLGNILDIELLVSIKQIPEGIRGTIERSLNEQFSRYKVRKVQLQWLGNDADLQSLINGESPTAQHKTNYELVIIGRKDKHMDEYEFLFNDHGALIRQQKIIESSQQHLIF